MPSQIVKQNNFVQTIIKVIRTELNPVSMFVKVLKQGLRNIGEYVV